MALRFDGNMASKSHPFLVYACCVYAFTGMGIMLIFLVLGGSLWYCREMEFYIFNLVFLVLVFGTS